MIIDKELSTQGLIKQNEISMSIKSEQKEELYRSLKQRKEGIGGSTNASEFETLVRSTDVQMAKNEGLDTISDDSGTKSDTYSKSAEDGQI